MITNAMRYITALLILFPLYARADEIGSGYYYIQSKVSGYNLDVYGANQDIGGRVCQAPGNPQQVWKFISDGHGYYFIQSKVSGYNLDVKGGNHDIGGEICQAPSSPQQVWKLISNGNGYYSIQSKVSGYDLDVYGANHDIGGRICQAPGNPQQVWKLILAPTTPEPNLVRAELKTKTPSQKEGDDKDRNTGVFVVVITNDKNTLLANISDADNALPYHDDNSVHSINLPLAEKNVPKDKCLHFAFKVGILARGGFNFGGVKFTMRQISKDFAIDVIPPTKGGNDHWFFHSWLTLYFSDGSTLESHKFDQNLDSRGGALTWTGLN